jgi:hypothetical protein
VHPRPRRGRCRLRHRSSSTRASSGLSVGEVSKRDIRIGGHPHWRPAVSDTWGSAASFHVPASHLHTPHCAGTRRDGHGHCIWNLPRPRPAMVTTCSAFPNVTAQSRYQHPRRMRPHKCRGKRSCTWMVRAELRSATPRPRASSPSENIRDPAIPHAGVLTRSFLSPAVPAAFPGCDGIKEADYAAAAAG